MTATLRTTDPSSGTAQLDSTSPHAYDGGLLLLRLALGLTVAAHGVQKLFGWFGGGGLEGTGQFFEMSGYPAGETMALIAGLSETLGGLALALGLLTPLAGAAVFGTMINALAVKWGGGFFAPEGVEYEILLAAGAAALALRARPARSGPFPAGAARSPSRIRGGRRGSRSGVRGARPPHP